MTFATPPDTSIPAALEALLSDDALACLACGAPTDGAETHPECTYDASPMTPAERERIARIRGGR